MRPKHRNKRIMLVVFFAALLGLGAVLLGTALRQNTQFFYNPSEVLVDGFDAKSESIRVGGLVLPDSVQQTGALTTRFLVADFEENAERVDPDTAISVTYTGVLPDLFKEGKGVVVGGIWMGDIFEADEVLAKHDENYQPKKKSGSY